LKSLHGNQTEEFYKEAAVMRELRHPNCVTIFGIVRERKREIEREMRKTIDFFLLLLNR
jgi:hypothetical protein